MKKIVSMIIPFLVVAFTLLFHYPTDVQAQNKVIEWRLQSAFTQTAKVYKHFERFRDEILKRSNGRLAIKLFPAYGLGYKREDPLFAVRDGLMEACHENLNHFTGAVPMFAVGNLPFIYNNNQEHVKGLEAVRTIYEKEFSKQNAKMVWLSALPLTYLFASKPVLKTEDFQGMKIRVAAKPVMNAITKLGASPQTIALAEAITALQTGVIDGQIWAIESGLSWKIQEVVHNASAWSFYGVEQAIFINKNKFDELPPDLQKIVIEVGHESEKDFTQNVLLGDDKSRKRMEATGKMKFFFPDTSEISKARVESKEVWDDWQKKTGRSGSEAIDIIEKALGRR